MMLSDPVLGPSIKGGNVVAEAELFPTVVEGCSLPTTGKGLFSVTADVA